MWNAKLVRQLIIAAALLALTGTTLMAQAPVVGVSDPESLFTSPDPKLNANKQVVLQIVRDLLEANHWSEAGKYLTEEYIQHNPLVASGLAPVMKFFGSRKPEPIPAKMKTKIVSVTAEGDLVVVAYAQEKTDSKDATKKYTTTWFDMWRIVNGKANEHWDPATK
jgi:predicted SnoaL-like aldol condensation-catalyzing enzyme